MSYVLKHLKYGFFCEPANVYVWCAMPGTAQIIQGDYTYAGTGRAKHFKIPKIATRYATRQEADEVLHRIGDAGVSKIVKVKPRAPKLEQQPFTIEEADISVDVEVVDSP